MSNNRNNQINIPKAREAMDRFKMQAAQEVGVNRTTAGHNQTVQYIATISILKVSDYMYSGQKTPAGIPAGVLYLWI